MIVVVLRQSNNNRPDTNIVSVCATTVEDAVQLRHNAFSLCNIGVQIIAYALELYIRYFTNIPLGIYFTLAKIGANSVPAELTFAVGIYHRESDTVATFEHTLGSNVLSRNIVLIQHKHPVFIVADVALIAGVSGENTDSNIFISGIQSEGHSCHTRGHDGSQGKSKNLLHCLFSSITEFFNRAGPSTAVPRCDAIIPPGTLSTLF